MKYSEKYLEMSKKRFTFDQNYDDEICPDKKLREYNLGRTQE